TGEPQLTREGYVGMDVHRGARIAAAGHGGQILVSEQTQKLLGERGDLRDLGEHRLKDMGAAERIFQLGEGDFPPLKSLGQTNLPVPATPFMGRARVLEEVVALLRRDDVRLVTLLGPGGTGKTRLSLEVAAQSADDYAAGVWFAALATLAEPGLVLPAIAQAMGLRDSGEGAFELIIRHIRGRATLLVIDNLEQLLPAAAHPLAALLAACPRLKLLVTSREPLRVSAEREFPVAPFVRDEAVAFFAERARAVRPDFAVGDENRATVEAVCARLDDLPLALELAAARVKLLSPGALLTRLEQRLPLLVGGARDAPERQRTLRGAIGWSHDLLPDEERRLFARVAVFTGGFTLEAAELVCAARLDELEALIDKSLVVFSDPPAGEPRFGMLETIREFALEQLDAGGDAAAQKGRHALFFCRLAEQAEEGLKGPEQGLWLDRLEADSDNLRASIEWSLAGDPSIALRMTAALWLFWYMHGHVTEGRGWLVRALTVADPAPSRTRAKALDGAGYLAGEQDDLETERALLEESLACARQIGSDEDVAIAGSHLMGCLVHDDPERAWLLGQEAVALARAAGSRWVLAMALNNLGALAELLGKRESRELIEESYRLRRAAGDASRIALSLVNLADLALLEGDPVRARPLLAEALELARQIGDKRHVVHALLALGWVELAERQFGEAAAQLRQCVVLARELGQIANLLEALVGLAGVAAAVGDAQRAARLTATTAAHRGLVVNDPDEAHHGVQRPYLEAARAGAGEAVWAAASAEGAAMSLDDAIDYALDGTVPG
ncbi:MAG: hypothetical protein QOC86_95, partial [Gaiellales bacterium]|nr:hypothetical protein [Gaiellales bacterium]